MSFLRVKKRRIQFNVELTVISLSDVPLLNAVIFAKVRLMDCGSFEGYTWHRPVRNYQVDFMKPLQPQPDEPPLEMPDVSESENPQPFRFQCRIPFDDRNGELEECKCKISLRKEDRSGRSPQKLGFVVLNLSEFAASGTTGITDSFLLDGYSGGQRQDNSRVQCHVTMMHQAQDPLFKVPTATVSAVEEANLNPVDRKAPSSTECSTPDGLDSGSKGVGEVPPPTHRHNSLASIIHSRFASDHHDDQPQSRPASCVASTSTSSSIVSGTADRASWHAGHPVQIQHFQGVTGSKPSGGTSEYNGVTSGINPLSPHYQPGRRMSEERSVAGSAGSTGLGQSLANRVQKTRRDAEDVIEEVLAENSQSLIESLDEDLLEGSNSLDRGSLALFISKDSNTAIVGQNAGRCDIVKGESGNGHEEDKNGHETMTRSMTSSKKGFEKVEFGSSF